LTTGGAGGTNPAGRSSTWRLSRIETLIFIAVIFIAVAVMLLA
jgi:hypothetical protein